jgi:rod shape-determining protein MreD
MGRIAFNNNEVRRRAMRRDYVPVVSTILACLFAALPIVVSTPIIPDLGFLMLIAWRLLRPEMWSPVIALPLGLLNDLAAGHPIGQSMALWTITFIVFDIADSRVLYRDYWMDWLFASLAIAGHIAAGWYIARLMGSTLHFTVVLPSLGASILAFPVIARIVLSLDRWRLAR